ncbi:MAG: iron-containing alcohol dehydrogenase [Deltaproteobacteria bacterium]|nr:iron-containing alcohol dehydrogenase [Deltaproteobacteria bacterium]
MPAVDDPIALLLEGRYPDPSTGELLRSDARAIVIEDSLAGREAELLTSVGLGRRIALIADEHTYAALGERVARVLRSSFDVQKLVSSGVVHADAETIARLGTEMDPKTDAVVAVGSGTLNDLAKMVAMTRRLPQVVFATAPSMNGYTSVSASISIGGVKRSLRAATPVASFFDLRVLAAAPLPMIRAGLGDSSCRPTAQADWLLSHLVLDRPYRETPFALLAGDEPALFADAAALVSGDLAAMRRLVRTLVLSGLGMTICGGSFPASQGEHLLSHYAEMKHPEGMREALHGEQIAVCALAMARLQDRILAREKPPVIKPSTITRDDVLAHFGAVAGAPCWSELEPKLFDRARAEELTARLASSWDAIRTRIAAVTHGAERMERVLAAAGAPTTPEALGWPPSLLTDGIAHAREIRNRYTFLDFAADTILE